MNNWINCLNRTRYAWIGSFILFILLLDCKSIVQDHVSIWMILVWLISIVLSVPFGVRVDCVTQHNTNVCFCVFTADQSEVVWLFVLSLILFSVAFTVALVALSLTSSSQRPHLGNNKNFFKFLKLDQIYPNCYFDSIFYLNFLRKFGREN